jgi:hypothetical protein
MSTQTPVAMSAPETSSHTFVIAANRLPVFRENLRKINKKAEKYGLRAFEAKLGERGKEYLENRSEGFAAHIDTVKVTVTGATFALGEYKLKAALNHKTQIYKAFGDFKIPGHFLAHAAECDHCKTQRERTKTFVLADTAGDLKHVGSSCIEDFTGVSIDHAVGATSVYLEFAQMVDAMLGIEGRPWGTTFEPAIDVEPFLTIVARRIRQHGWVSASQARANRETYSGGAAGATDSTAADALKELQILLSKRGWDVPVVPEAEPQDFEVAKDALAHARDCYADVPTREEVADFDANMWAVSSHDMVLVRQTALAAFIVRKYYSEVLEPRALTQFGCPSEHVGTVKKREEFVITVDRLTPRDSTHGLTTFVTMHDPAGNQLRWNASGSPDLEATKSYRVKATVKNHAEYKGIKQTTLLRVDVLEQLNHELQTESSSSAVAEPSFEP